MMVAENKRGLLGDEMYFFFFREDKLFENLKKNSVLG